MIVLIGLGNKEKIDRRNNKSNNTMVSQDVKFNKNKFITMQLKFVNMTFKSSSKSWRNNFYWIICYSVIGNV